MMARKPLHVLILISLISSCASIRPLGSGQSKTAKKEVKGSFVRNKAKEETIVIVDDEDLTSLETKTLDVKSFEREQLKKEDPVTTVAESEARFSLDYKKKHYDFWIKYFTTRNKDRFARHVKNGLKFKSTVERIFKEEGLPKDLFYVGLIESGYNTHIRSHASAVGPWQFIKGTATRYNLYVDSHLDERRNIFKATRAAANYFKDLYNIFGSWELALCAYNAGEYRIINAIRKGNTRDYKELVSKKLLPKETIFYIPKVAAAKTLVESHFSKMKTPVSSRTFENAHEVEVGKPISLKRVAKEFRLPYGTLKQLNPDVKRDYVGKRRHYSLYLPKRLAGKAIAKIRKMPRPKRVNRLALKRKIHRVRKGESLYKIARRYNTTIAQLKRNNNIRRNRIYVGQRLKVRAPASKSTSKSIHIVRRGENLSKIASKYGITLRTLKGLNNLRTSKITVGQRLKVSGKSSKVYVVRRGDNLYRIARKFGVSVNRIVQANSLKDKRIFPKQKIILPI